MKFAFPIQVALVLALCVPLRGQILSTKLKVTVLNDHGNVVEKAIVNLYHTHGDYLQSKNAWMKATSDEKGVAVFKKLSEKSYYLEVRRGDMSNDSKSVKTSVLERGKLNKVNVIIE